MSKIKSALKSGENPQLPVSLSSREGNVGGSLGADYWENHLANWNQSGLSQAEYCRRHNLNYKTFCKWKERFSDYYPSRSSVKLVEVRRDFGLNVNSSSFDSVGNGHGYGGRHARPGDVSGSSSSGINIPGPPGPVLSPSGIRFWCGDFCIEIGVQFSSPTLSQLLQTLEELNVLKNRTRPDRGEGGSGSGGGGGEEKE